LKHCSGSVILSPFSSFLVFSFFFSLFLSELALFFDIFYTSAHIFSPEIFQDIDPCILIITPYYCNCAGMKNVMLITSTEPFIGVTIDDGRQKPALYKQYDFG
jgi:hypothetical protein